MIMKIPSGRRPWVAASLIDYSRLVDDARRAVRDGADLLEVRADLFPRKVLSPEIMAEKLREVRRAARRPILLTLRLRREGGGWPFSEIKRLSLYQTLMPWVDAVDVEGASEIAQDVIRFAKKLKRWAILSQHDFKKTPTDDALRRMSKRFSRSGADLLKIAATPRRKEDVDRLMSFCSGLSGRRAFIAMGSLGRRTRLEGIRWGSCLTYGSAGKSAAPGQVPVKLLAKKLLSLS